MFEETRLRKSFGQHLLVDKNIIYKIIGSVSKEIKDTVIEIGPGQGALTTELAKIAKKLVCVEIDNNMCRILADKLKSYNNVELVNQDILKYDLSLFKNAYAVGNIPYNITSLIIAYLINNKDSLSGFTLMVQKEFARRIIAHPGIKDYSAFTCFVNYYTVPNVLFKVSKGCFLPKPKVDSAIVRFDIRSKQEFLVNDEKQFFKIIRAGFNKRRKTLVNSLMGLFDKPKILSALDSLKLSEKIRAESLSLHDFARLSNFLNNN